MEEKLNRIWSYVLIALLLVGASMEARADRSDTLIRTFLGNDFVGRDAKLDPRQVPSRNILIILYDIFEPLVVLNAAGDVIGGAAERSQLSDDGRVWTFHLRKDRRWSDGEPVTAGDFVFALSAKLGDSNDARGRASKIVGKSHDDDRPVGVRALDDHTVEIEMVDPFALELGFFAGPQAAPLPSHVAPAGEHYWSTWPNRPSNGAYRLSSVDEEGNILLERNPHWPHSDPRSFRQVKLLNRSWETAMPEFLAGDIDILSNIPQNQMSFFTTRGFSSAPQRNTIYYLVLNVDEERLSDARVRRAMAISVDRARIVTRLFSSVARPTANLVPIGLHGWTGMDSGTRLDEARALMREAGYHESKRHSIKLSGHDSILNRRIGELVRQDLAQIFIDVELDYSMTNISAWFEKVEAGEYQIATMRRTPHVATPLGYMAPCSTLRNPFCGFFADDRFQSRYSLAAQKPDGEDKLSLLQEAERILLEEAALIIIAHHQNPLVLSETTELADGRQHNMFPVSSNFIKATP